jgi:hypothetical protein
MLPLLKSTVRLEILANTLAAWPLTCSFVNGDEVPIPTLPVPVAKLVPPVDLRVVKSPVPGVVEPIEPGAAQSTRVFENLPEVIFDASRFGMSDWDNEIQTGAAELVPFPVLERSIRFDVVLPARRALLPSDAA